MKYIIGMPLLMIGCVLALVLGVAIGNTIFGGGTLGILGGLGVSALLIAGLCHIGEGLGLDKD